MEQLKNGQEVIFTIKDIDYIYIVYSQHLFKGAGYNSQIFKDLGLDKFKFCSDCYGYNPGRGDWPESERRIMQL